MIACHGGAIQLPFNNLQPDDSVGEVLRRQGDADSGITKIAVEQLQCVQAFAQTRQVNGRAGIVGQKIETLRRQEGVSVNAVSRDTARRSLQLCAVGGKQIGRLREAVRYCSEH